MFAEDAVYTHTHTHTPLDFNKSSLTLKNFVKLTFFFFLCFQKPQTMDQVNVTAAAVASQLRRRKR
ncbi:hypothetical protein INR49_024035 [Caranx melampygus]|nr:hypothetical protein INR49_024035 [Caranx melampygus]